MELEEIQKKYNNLHINLMKICGYLSDYEIDKAIESEDFNFIWNTMFDYFKSKDPGYLLTKFEESGLKGKIEDDINFSLDEWFKVQDELKQEEQRLKDELPNQNIRGKDEYIMEMIKKRKYND